MPRLLPAVLLCCALSGRAAGDSATAMRSERGRAEHGSLSCGSANRGALAYPAQIEPEGDAWVKPPPWKRRGLNFGTDELVGVIERAARRVAEQFPGSTLGVADMSKQAGGAAVGHASHQSGRDADILYYAIDRAGNFVYPDSSMPVYTETGRAYYADAPEYKPHIRQRWFDLARNWALVEALIEDREANVVAIFVSGTIERWLLDYARAIGRPPRLIERAALILASPRGTPVHRDHMHIRVGCSPDDIAAGECTDESAPRRGRGRRWTTKITCP
ncbi:MAG TPA: penicillin-insensitive murein endopeptidase [Kofleriaceae bacterium]|nr:penicillin-insensitive murein endopeptidase [Kofleriaceae bacterium]